MRLRIGRRLLITGGLAAALLAVAVITLRDEAPAGTVPGTSNSLSGGRTPQAEVPVVDVRIEELTEQSAPLAETDRNPFRFQSRLAPPPSAVAPVRPVPLAPGAPAGPPPQLRIALRFIGLLEAPTQVGRVAVLSDGRGNVFYGKEGDIIEGRYQVLKIGTDTAELAFIDGRGRQTIRLAGQ